MMAGTVLAGSPTIVPAAASVIRSRVLRTWGQSESGLAEILADRIDALDDIGNPTLAFQASGIEGIKVRITAKAARRGGGRRAFSPTRRNWFAACSAMRDLRRRRRNDGIGGSRRPPPNPAGPSPRRKPSPAGSPPRRLTRVRPRAWRSFVGGTVGPRGPGRNRAPPAGTGAPRGTPARRRRRCEVREGFGASLGIAALGPDPGEDAPPGTGAHGGRHGRRGGPGGRRRTPRASPCPATGGQVREYAVIHLLSFLQARPCRLTDREVRFAFARRMR